MHILLVNGSSQNTASNSKFLDELQKLNDEMTFTKVDSLADLPLYTVQRDQSPFHPAVSSWRSQVDSADGVIFSFPTYLHNIPAILKNGLEWLTTSGNLRHKKTIAISYTPHHPRGDKGMQSALWSLSALNTNILASVKMYHQECFLENTEKMAADSKELLSAMLDLF